MVYHNVFSNYPYAQFRTPFQQRRRNYAYQTFVRQHPEMGMMDSRAAYRRSQQPTMVRTGVSPEAYTHRIRPWTMPTYADRPYANYEQGYHLGRQTQRWLTNFHACVEKYRYEHQDNPLASLDADAVCEAMSPEARQRYVDQVPREIEEVALQIQEHPNFWEMFKRWVGHNILSYRQRIDERELYATLISTGELPYFLYRNQKWFANNL